MKQNESNWTAAKEQAAREIAEGVMAEGEIAKNAGIKRVQFYRWKQEAKFKQRVKAIVAELSEVSRTRSIGRREDRVEAQDERWRMFRDALEKRKGEIPEMDLEDIVKELREHEKQSAQELGQLTNKHEHTGADGKAIQVESSNVPDWSLLTVEELLVYRDLHERIAARAGQGNGLPALGGKELSTLSSPSVGDD